MRLASLVWLVALDACGFNINTGTSIDANGSGDGSNTGSDGDIDTDASIDGAMIDAPTAQWTVPVPLGFSNVDDPTLTGDLLQIWFDQGGDIYHASRVSSTVPFGIANRVDELSTGGTETTPEVTSDGRTITIGRLTGNNDLYISDWNVSLQSWSSPSPMNDLNTSDFEQTGSLSDDRLMLAFTRNTPTGSADIYFTTRAGASDAWGTAVPKTELNTTAQDGNVFLSGDKLTVCFDSQRASVQNDIYCAARATDNGVFGTPFPMTQINSPQSDQDPWLSPNGTVMVFWSDRDGTGKLWYSVKI